MKTLIIVIVLSCCLAPRHSLASTAGDSSGISLEADFRAPRKANSQSLQLNFRGAPLDEVLNHLSAAAGFTLDLEGTPTGTVGLWSSLPLTQSEAYHLLLSCLATRGYAAIREGTNLTVVKRSEALTRGIPVRLGDDPQNIPANDEFATQIIPVRLTDVGRIMKDVQALAPAGTVITANESANAIVVTGTQSTARHLAEVIKALETDTPSLLRVFQLKHADPDELVSLIAELFPDSDSSKANQPSVGFNGGPGFGPPGPGGFPGEGNSSDASNIGTQRAAKRTRVTAVADPRTGAVIVNAAAENMTQIERLVAQLDSDPARAEKLSTFSLKNAHAPEVAKVLTDLFQRDGSGNTRAASTSTSTDPLDARATSQSQQNASGIRTSLGASQGSPGGGGGPMQ
jgi:type II secretory pathway component GspD/PulD (secretin)